MDISTIRFGIICDCQYTDAENDWYDNEQTGFHGDRHYRKSLAKLDEAINFFNQQGVDFTVHLGDLADRDKADYQAIMPIIERSQAPLYHVLGNHDYKAASGNRELALTCLKLKDAYYSFFYNGFRFIILDSNELSAIDKPRGSAERQEMVKELEDMRKKGVIMAYPWNGRVGPDQVRWLEQELIEAKSRAEKVIVMAHHPVFPNDAHNALNDTEVLELLARFEIVAYFNGHNHHGNYGEYNGVPFITFPAMVESSTNAYSLAKVSKDSIDIRGFGRHRDYQIKI